VLNVTKQQPGISLQAVPATVVFGADGFVGSNILAFLRRVNPDCVGSGRRFVDDSFFLDLACPDIRPLGLRERGISHAVIAAGVSGVVVCEQQPAKTRAVNVEGTAELARQLNSAGIRVLALSSDYVFDGIGGNYVESSPVNPLNEYGCQKADMESALLDSDGDVLLVRLSKVFDTRPGSGTLLDEMVGRMRQGKAVSAARDQIFCPTHIDDIAAVLRQLLVSGLTGIVHLCAPTKTSRLELALKVADAFGYSSELVHEIRLRDLGTNVLRPLDTSMIPTHFEQMPPGRFTSLDASIARLKSNYGNGTADEHV